VPNEEAAQELVRTFRQLTPGNRALAIEALRRTPERQQLLLESGVDAASK